MANLLIQISQRSRLACLLLLICVAYSSDASLSYAQSDLDAHPQGWSIRPPTQTAEVESAATNRPVRLDSFEQNDFRKDVGGGSERSKSYLPDNSIREQIGLASFQEPLDWSDDPSVSNSPSASSKTGESNPSFVATQDAVNKSDQTDSLPVSQFELPFIGSLGGSTNTLTSPNGIQGSLKFAVLLGALSLAPAIVLMTTCYIRVVVVLSLLKQAFGGHQMPPAQILTALSLFITFLVMTPVWSELKQSAIDPYSANEITQEQAWSRGVAPVKNFMIRQIEAAGNQESVAVFYKYADVGASLPPDDLQEVPLNVLIPAFMVSELKIAFLLGFQIYLPFLVMDLIVSSVTVSMGMLMLPPQMVSFPLKLILFVLVDGWSLVVGMLLQSVGASP